MHAVRRFNLDLSQQKNMAVSNELKSKRKLGVCLKHIKFSPKMHESPFIPWLNILDKNSSLSNKLNVWW